MRTRAIFACLAAGALFAPSAQAGMRGDYKQQVTTAGPGTSTGTDPGLLYKKPSHAAAKPIPVRKEVFTFPDGTTYDETAVPNCTASDVEIILLGRSACPAESWMGGGQGDTIMTGFDGSETPISLDGWDNHGELVLLGGTDMPPIKQVTRAERVGQTTTVVVPQSPGGPPDGESALRYVHNVFAARSHGPHAYIRTPPICPASGSWTFKGEFTFADGVVENDVYEMPCN